MTITILWLLLHSCQLHAIKPAFAGGPRHRQGPVKATPERSGNPNDEGQEAHPAAQGAEDSFRKSVDQSGIPVIKVGDRFAPAEDPLGSPGLCSQKHPIETFVQISSTSDPEAVSSGGVRAASC